MYMRYPQIYLKEQKKNKKQKQTKKQTKQKQTIKPLEFKTLHPSPSLSFPLLDTRVSSY